MHHSLFLISLVVASVSSDLRKPLISSSHLFSGLPTVLHVLILALRPGLHSAAFFFHLVSGCEAILIASLHVILLCVSIQHGILAAFIRSSASAVLLFYVFNSVLLFNFLPCRFHLYRLRRRRRCTGRNPCWINFPLQFRLRSFCGFLFLLHLHPSRYLFVCPSSFPFFSLLACVFILYFLLVCKMSWSMLR